MLKPDVINDARQEIGRARMRLDRALDFMGSSDCLENTDEKFILVIEQLRGLVESAKAYVESAYNDLQV